MDYEPISSYPKLGRRHVFWCALSTGITVAVVTLELSSLVANEEAILAWNNFVLLYFAFMGVFYVPSVVFMHLREPKVRLGPDWIESWSDHLGKRRRESLADLERVALESRDLIRFELRDGRELTLWRRHVGRYDWPELRAELAYRLDCYDGATADTHESAGQASAA